MKRVYNYEDIGYDYREPQSPAEPEYIDDTEEIVIDLDAIINIDKDGNWVYEDETYPWARSDEADDEIWMTESDQYPSFELADFYQVTERTDELLEPVLPFSAGRYHISGKVTLVYNVEDVEKYPADRRNANTDPWTSWRDDWYNTDDASIDFQYDQSSIEDFEIEELK